MSDRLRSVTPLVVLGLAVLVAAYIGGTSPDGPPLDPTSAGPTGTRALVETLAGLGADVRIAAGPRRDDTVAVVLTDTLDDRSRDDLEVWVEGGGTLLLSDPLSPLAPDTAGLVSDAAQFTATPLERACELPAVGLVDEVRPPGSGAVLRAPADATGCFPAERGDWLVAEPRGEGTLVTVGGPEVLTNAQLRVADHALLAVSIIAPSPQEARVTVVRPPRPGEGDATLVDLVPGSVRLALAQLGLALLLLVAWRARRLARPVEEPGEVAIPASELVVASGNLLADAGARARAARMLRDDLRRRLAERCGLPPSTSAAQLADVLVARHGVDREDVARVFDGEPASDDALVTLAQSAERLRREVLHPIRPGGST